MQSNEQLSKQQPVWVSLGVPHSCAGALSDSDPQERNANVLTQGEDCG